jgi:hypothetical protein
MENYKTNDLELAAYLYTKEVKYLGVMSEVGMKMRYLFQFEDKDICDKLKVEFMNGGFVPANVLLQNRKILINELKSFKEET